MPHEGLDLAFFSLRLLEERIGGEVNSIEIAVVTDILRKRVVKGTTSATDAKTILNILARPQHDGDDQQQQQQHVLPAAELAKKEIVKKAAVVKQAATKKAAVKQAATKKAVTTAARKAAPPSKVRSSPTNYDLHLAKARSYQGELYRVRAVKARQLQIPLKELIRRFPDVGKVEAQRASARITAENWQQLAPRVGSGFQKRKQAAKSRPNGLDTDTATAPTQIEANA